MLGKSNAEGRRLARGLGDDAVANGADKGGKRRSLKHDDELGFSWPQHPSMNSGRSQAARAVDRDGQG